MAILGAQQRELPLPPSANPSKYKRDDVSFALPSNDSGKCQLSAFLVSQGNQSNEEEGPQSRTDDLLFVIQAQDVSVGSPEILDQKIKKINE